jgi:hypothetical protein
VTGSDARHRQLGGAQELDETPVLEKAEAGRQGRGAAVVLEVPGAGSEIERHAQHGTGPGFQKDLGGPARLCEATLDALVEDPVKEDPAGVDQHQNRPRRSRGDRKRRQRRGFRRW